MSNNNDTGVTKLTPEGQAVAKGLTTAVGHTVSGASNLVGGTVGAVGRGGGDIVTGITGGVGAPIGAALTSLGNGVQDGAAALGNGAKRAGQWR